jgi:hypothetical protein
MAHPSVRGGLGQSGALPHAARMSLTLLLGSIIAVIAFVVIARMLGLGGGTIADEAEARHVAEAALPGFAADEAFVSKDGRAALVLGADGAALVKQHGTQPAVRRLARPVRAEPLPDGVRVDSGDRMFGPLSLQLAPEARDKLLTLL